MAQYRHSILVVDDEPDILDLMPNLLSGYDLRLAREPTEAVEMLNAARVDLLITDLRMPGCTGFTLIERALLIHPGLRVMIISGNAVSCPPELSKAIVCCIAKPFRRAEFRAAVSAALMLSL